MLRRGAWLCAGAACVVAAVAHADPPPFAWKPSTASPASLRGADARSAKLLAGCGTPDSALTEVASHGVERQLGGAGLFASDELGMLLRVAGDPHVWPRAWSIAGDELEDDEIAARLGAWIKTTATLGVRRCGIARGTKADGTVVVAAVSVDALADLAPLPTTARVGQWITLDGTMLVAATNAQVVLLGPRGAPKTIIASLSGNRIRSTFSVDQAGPWLVQVMATVSTGPRPVLEAMVFAGTAPPTSFVRTPAPGEDAARGAKDDDDAMFRMVGGARAAEGLPGLVRDPALDKLARAHSEEMKRARMVGHDVGGGDPRARIEAAGIQVRVAGENAASASTLEGAHRALWASPSHRGNLLLSRFGRVGVGVVRSDGGNVWVTQIFAD